MPLPANEYRPQLMTARRPLVSWLIISAGALLFCWLLIAAPLAVGSHDRFALTIYRAFSALCHQLPERSFFIAGHQFAVCARCTGLYAGFTLALLVYPLIRSLTTTFAPPRKWLLISAIPMTVDFSLTFFGIWENTHSSRFLTGFLLGGVAVFYVMPGIAELSLWGWPGPTRKPLATFTVTSPEHILTAPSDYSAPERRI
jgi:uncharacterized membrane protein